MAGGILCDHMSTRFAREGVTKAYFLLLGFLRRVDLFSRVVSVRTLVSNHWNLTPDGLAIKGNVLVHVIEKPRDRTVSGAQIFTKCLLHVRHCHRHRWYEFLSVKQVAFCAVMELRAQCSCPQDLVTLRLLGGFCVAFCWYVRGREAGLCRVGEKRIRSPNFLSRLWLGSPSSTTSAVNFWAFGRICDVNLAVFLAFPTAYLGFSFLVSKFINNP